MLRIGHAMNTAIVNPSPSASAEDSHRQIKPGARVRLDAGVCLPERFPSNECGMCISACPLGILASEGGAPALTDGAAMQADACIGCGQCAAVCPTGALHVDGFVVPKEIPGGEEVMVDCWRVPVDDSPPGALRVPCLGGLSAGWLLSVFDQSGERPLRLLDRAQCDECPAGQGIKTLLGVITETRMMLFEAGVTMDFMPMLVYRPTTLPLLPSIPEQSAVTPITRRSFFRALLGESVRTVDDLRAPVVREPGNLRTPTQPLERLRVSAALERIARRHDREVPRRALPSLTMADCSAHGVCAAVCPTGALQRQSTDGGAVEMQFNAGRCIACGQCARTCPDKAIRIDAEGGSAGMVVLHTWPLRDCAECGDEYPDISAGSSSSALCPACRRAQDFSMGVAAFLRAPDCPDVSQS